MEANNQALQYIPIDKISFSETNTRKHYDESKLMELADSIKQVGLMQAVLVRPAANGTYQLIYGERRLRACKLLAFKEIKAEIANLPDEQVLEVQAIENLQRADIHPLDEALGYGQLAKEYKYDCATIGAKVGKSSAYIAQRLQLTNLIPEFKTAFKEESILTGHAMELARLTENQQQQLVNYVLDEHDYHAFIDEKKKKKFFLTKTVDDLKEHIRMQFHLEIKTAPFNTSDDTLIENVPSCINCPKRTGFNQDLFNDIKNKDTCTDPACFKAKVDKNFKNVTKSLRKNGETYVKIKKEYGGACPADVLSRDQYTIVDKEDKSTTIAVISDGSDKGKKVFVKVKPEGTAKLKRAKMTPEEKEKQPVNNNAAQERKEKAAKLYTQIRTEIFKQIVPLFKNFSALDNSILVEIMEDGVNMYYLQEFAKDIPKLSSFRNTNRDNKKYLCSLKREEIIKFMILAFLAGEVDINYWDLEDHKGKNDFLYAKAKELKIDTTAIEAKFAAPETKEPVEKKQPAKSKSKPKSKTAAKTKKKK